MLANILSIIAICISVVAIPAGYLLGCRSARHASYNNKIDELALATQQILQYFVQFYNKNYEDGNTNYHLMVANQKKLQRFCDEIEKLGSIKQRSEQLDNLLIEIKLIITNKVFSKDQLIKEQSLPELIIKFDQLNSYFSKKFI